MIDYTGKDFPALYNEMLQLIPELTDKWVTSSEIDPGMVLVKLMAIMGDKLNYNNDKNSLENMISYVTQRKNARALFKDRGYNMQWYKAGTGVVSVRINSVPQLNSGTAPTTRVIKFSTPIVFSNEKEDMFFTCVNANQTQMDATVGNFLNFDIVQGSYITYTTSNASDSTPNGVPVSELINNSITLPNLKVAQNAIYITGDNITIPFERVDNVLLYPDKNCFELDIDDKEQTCTLVFSESISKFNTLFINYIVTDGLEGNSSAGTITKIKSKVSILTYTNDEHNEEELDTSNLGIYQEYEITGGDDAETINQAEYNYKLQLPKSDALITSSDYRKKIKSLKNYNDVPFISNVMISDRNTDINFSKSGYVLDSGAEVYKVVQSSPNPFSLFAYLIGETTNYAGGFVPVCSSSLLVDINDALQEERIIKFNLIYPTPTADNSSNKFYWLLAKYCPNIQVVTKEKVTQSQGSEIISNILNAIKYNFSCDKLNLGEAIDYYTLYSVCINADSRIQALALEPLKYTYTMYTVDSSNLISSVEFDDSIVNNGSVTQIVCDLLERMILEGKIPYYKYNSLSHNLLNNSVLVEDIVGIETNLQLNIPSSTKYRVKTNEIVELMAPYYQEINKYGSGITFNFFLPAESGTQPLPEFTLKKGQYYTCADLPKMDGETLSVNLLSTDIGVPGTYKIVSNYQDIKLDENGSTTLTINDTISVYKKSTQKLGEGKYIFQCTGLFFNNSETGIEAGCKITQDDDVLYLTIPSGASYYMKPGDQLLFTPTSTDSSSLSTEIISYGSGTVLYNSSSIDVTLYFLRYYDQSLSSVDMSFRYAWDNSIEIVNSELVSIPSGTQIESTGDISCSTMYVETTYEGPLTFTDSNYISVISGNTQTSYKLSTYGDYYTMIPLMAIYFIENESTNLYSGQNLKCFLNDGTSLTIYGDRQQSLDYITLTSNKSIPLEFVWYKADEDSYNIVYANASKQNNVDNVFQNAGIVSITPQSGGEAIPVTRNSFIISETYVISGTTVKTAAGVSSGTVSPDGKTLTLGDITYNISYESITPNLSKTFTTSLKGTAGSQKYPQYILSIFVSKLDDDCSLKVSATTEQGSTNATISYGSQSSTSGSLSVDLTKQDNDMLGKTLFFVISCNQADTATTINSVSVEISAKQTNPLYGVIVTASPQIQIIEDKFDSGNEQINEKVLQDLTNYSFNFKHVVTDSLQDYFGYGVFDTSHPFNKWTLPVMDEKNVNISIAKQSKGY